MSTSHDHHYCPIFYLNGFVNQKGKLWRYDKGNKFKPGKWLSPPAIMYEIDMNTFDLPWGKDSTAENALFSRLEDAWGKIIEKIRSCRDLKTLEQKELTLLIEFVSWQYVRTPFFIQEMQRLRPTLTKVGNLVARFKYATSLQRSFLAKALTFLIAQGTKFITSDKPCFLYENYQLKFIPLSSDVLLSWDESEDGKLKLSRHELNEEGVNGMNRLVASDAKRYIVGPDTPVVDLAVEAAKNDPEF